MNRTTFLRQEEVADGYNGKKTVGNLCYDPDALDILCVYPFGWHRMGFYPVASVEQAIVALDAELVMGSAYN